MRNVYKGFQFSQLAVPKMHAAAINSSFTAMHSPKPPSMLRRPPAAETAKPARRPGKNPGIKSGYSLI